MRNPAATLLLILAAALAAPSASAQQLYGACHASSSYDLTLAGNDLVFQREAPTPRKVTFADDGHLHVDGRAVALDAEGRDRAALFAEGVHQLIPKVRALAQRGVSLAARSLRARAGDDPRIDQAEQQLHTRIADSRSTRDWDGPQGQAYLQNLTLELGGVLASSLADQALQAAMSGNLQQAEALRDRAANVTTGLHAELQQDLAKLRPQIEALCPQVQRLARLQAGIRLPSSGQPLDLIDIDRGKAAQ